MTLDPGFVRCDDPLDSEEVLPVRPLSSESVKLGAGRSVLSLGVALGRTSARTSGFDVLILAIL